MTITCKSCKFEYKGFGLPYLCPACRRCEWDTPKADVLEGDGQNPLDEALKMLEAYEKGCDPRTLHDIDE